MANEEERAGIAAILREKLSDPGIELRLLSQAGSSRIYLGTSGERRYFVKYPDESARMYGVLKAGKGCPYLPASFFPAPEPFAGGFITCLAWRPSDSVPVEKWTDAQLDSFLAAYAEFFEVLQRTDDVGEPEDDAAFYKTVCDYAERHPLAARLMKPLLSLPSEERTYLPGERLSVTHGDLHGRNYGFRGETFAYFYDIDNVLRGYPTEDLAYTVLDRAQRRSVSGAKFMRCVEVLRRMMVRFDRPSREWRVAINRKRIRQAASKVLRRPNSFVPAVDVFLHDRKAVRLMREAMGEG